METNNSNEINRQIMRTNNNNNRNDKLLTKIEYNTAKHVFGF